MAKQNVNPVPTQIDPGTEPWCVKSSNPAPESSQQPILDKQWEPSSTLTEGVFQRGCTSYGLTRLPARMSRYAEPYKVISFREERGHLQRLHWAGHWGCLDNRHILHWRIDVLLRPTCGVDSFWQTISKLLDLGRWIIKRKIIRILFLK